MKFISLFVGFVGLSRIGSLPAAEEMLAARRRLAPSDDIIFNVTNLSAAAVLLSHRVSYMFQVSVCAGEPALKCTDVATSGDETLVSIPWTWCESNVTGVIWKWDQNSDGGAQLNIVREFDDGSVQKATRFIEADQIDFTGDGKFRHQLYTGPQNFSLSAYPAMGGGGGRFE